jgi:hypothetical protein
MRKPKTQPDEEISFQAAFASLVRGAREYYARNPPPKDTVAPEPFRVRSVAEQDLKRSEITYRLQGLLCPDPARCDKHRCRRLSRCKELTEIASQIEELRALVAKERAAATGAADTGTAIAEAGRNELENERQAARAPDRRGTRRSRRQRKH